MYLSHNGKKIEQFESSSIKTKKRDVDCFMNWVESHVGNVKSISPNFKRVNKSRKYQYQYTNKQSRRKRRQSRYKQNKNKYRNNRVSKNRR